ncbi:hypothetical protein I552_8599 [Mycobacterium xenopi 3993]|nr:hypothetical protein I552_8599 [Mycobacterium xenopi 3993]
MQHDDQRADTGKPAGLYTRYDRARPLTSSECTLVPSGYSGVAPVGDTEHADTAASTPISAASRATMTA